MLVIIIFIFLNSNLVNAFDESAENKYINELPEKEKKELLERVARRIIQEVKSNEAVAGMESGEVPEEELKLHSEYVAQLLNDERKQLKSKYSDIGNDITKTKRSVDSMNIGNDEEIATKSVFLENTTENIQTTTQEILKIDRVDNEPKNYLSNNKSENLDKSKEIDKIQDVEKTETVEVPNNYNVYNNNKGSIIDLTLRSDTQHDNVKVDEDKVLGLLENEKKDSNSNSEPSNSNNITAIDKTNDNLDKQVSKSPISIEIKFVNDEDDDFKKEKSNVTDEIPVKVIYDEKLQEKSHTQINTETSKKNENASIESQKLEIRNDTNIGYRKSLSDAVEDNVKEIEDTLDNNVARKKRKSSETVSLEVTRGSNDSHSNISELIDFKHFENVSEIGYTKDPTNSHSESNSEKYNNEHLELTTGEVAVFNNNTSPEVSNITKFGHGSEIEISTTVHVDMETKSEKIPETTTEKQDIQHTQIDHFDADDNDTISDFTVNANVTGSTTEEIVKMRTKHISGYPEDSYENETTTVKTSTKNDYPRNESEQIPKNLSTVNVNDLRSSEIQMTNYSSKISADSKKHQVPIVADLAVPNIDINSSFDIPKEKNERNLSLNKEKDDTVAAEHNSANETNAPKDVIVELITSTTIEPLTTAESSKKTELYYAMELPVEIRNGSFVAATYNNENKTVDEALKEPLRHGLSSNVNFKDIRDHNKDNVPKIKPLHKKYAVYEILPGEDPFVKIGSIDHVRQKSKKRNSSYPNIAFYQLSKQDKKKKIFSEQPSQIEQPNYAPVYNYAPEYAYYNPRNLYGPNADDEKIKIIDERSNEVYEEDLDKVFDYGIPQSFENQPNSDTYIMSNKNKRTKDTQSKRVSEDYYFGILGSDLNSWGHQYERSGSRKRSKKHKKEKSKKSKSKNLIKVPPNSDEYEHVRNAMLEKKPAITHDRQVAAILANLGYFGYNHNHLHSSVHKHNPYKKTLNVSSEAWVGPHEYEDDKKKKKKFLRSGGDFSLQMEEKRPKRLLSLQIPHKLKQKMKNELNKKNRSFHFNSEKYNSEKHHNTKKKYKRHLYLLTGNPKPVYEKERRPMVFLTGGLKESDWKDKYKRKHKKQGNFFKNHYVLGQESSEKIYKASNKNKFSYSKESDDIDKKIDRSGSVEDIGYGTPSDTSYENETLPTLDKDVVSMILNITENDPTIQSALINSLKKQKLLYRPPEKAVIKEYEHILKQHDSDLQYFLRSHNEAEVNAYVTVMKDMINVDKNYALENYDWLGSTVDIRSAMKKIAILRNVINENPNKLHPKDVQLTKYILYLYSTTKNLREPNDDNEELLAESDSNEYPKNKRFTYKERESVELPKNMRFPVKYKQYFPIQKSVHFTRKKYRPNQRPWLNKDDLKERFDEYYKFVEDVDYLLNDLHDAIKHISYITQYKSQKWFKNLKELYLAQPSRKIALEVMLHITTSRLIQLIEKSAISGLNSNYVRYSMNNPEEIEETKEEFALVFKIYLELKKLQ